MTGRGGGKAVTEGVVESGFSGKRTAELVGITYRQLDYWARTDLIRPSLADAQGSGSRRAYSYQDLLELKVVKTLLDAGIRLEMVRDVFSYLRENLGTDVASANLVINGSSPVLVSGEEIIDLIHKGQGVLNVLPLAGVKEELDNAIIDLFPSVEDQIRATGERRTYLGILRGETHRRRVHAITVTSRLRPIGEDVTQMSSADMTHGFYAYHPVRVVDLGFNRCLRERLPEARPT